MKFIRNCLVMPANNPAMLLKCVSYKADALFLDLEDAVSPNEKDAARRLLVAHLKFLDYGDTQVMVRVNPIDTEMFLKDMAAVLPLNIDAIIVPKIENAEQIRLVESLVEKYENKEREPIAIVPIVETALGISHVEEVALASKRVIGVIFGAADYTASIGARQTKAGHELFFGRAMVANACGAANIWAIDAPCCELNDEDEIINDSNMSRDLGYSCKICINPRQIPVVNRVFTPTEAEIDWARRVIEAKKEHAARGVGVFSVDGKMVDLPVALRAQRIMDIASALNLDN